MNYTALIVAAVVSFIIGAIWYSPMLFGKVWMKASGMHEGANKGGNMAGMFVLQFIFGLIQVWALAWLLRMQGVITMQSALLTGLVIWGGFVLMNAWGAQLWETKSHTAMWISVFCNLITVLVAAAILVSF